MFTPRKNTAFWWVRYPDRTGKMQRESTGTTDKEEAERFLRARLDARDEGRLSGVLKGKTLTFNEWADWFVEKRSKPPFRSENKHAQNLNALKRLRPVFGDVLLADITPEAIEDYLRSRLDADKCVRTKLGIPRVGKLKPYTVRQELRVSSRILNLAVQQKRLALNPCASVEFPAPINKSFRKPHYMTSSEQARIEMVAPSYLKNLVIMMTEVGFRPHKELPPMTKSQVDLENSVVSLYNSQTPSRIGNLPMTKLAHQAFKNQMEAAGRSDHLFPTLSTRAKKPYITSLPKIWEKTLRRAGVPYFPIYHLRHTFATRPSAGGVTDHFVTQMLHQEDSRAFKRYGQAKLMLMRETLAKLDHLANEHTKSLSTDAPN